MHVEKAEKKFWKKRGKP